MLRSISPEEDIMSDGDIGPGMSYCATIRISGDLDKAKLQAVIAEIEKALKQPGVDGEIESHARISTAAKFDARISPTQKS
jgi:hypothetical protein